MKAFAEIYPRVDDYKTSAEKSWEYLFCAFFALLSAGVIGTNSPIATFYSLLLSSFNHNKKYCRINDKKGNEKENNKFKGRRIYLSALALIHVLSYSLYIGQEKPGEWGTDGSGRLVPQSLFPQNEFQKRFKTWLSGLCNHAGISITPSIRTIVNLARINLLRNYPPFVIGLFSRKVVYSPIPDATTAKRSFDPEKPLKNYRDSSMLDFFDESAVVINPEATAGVDRDYSRTFDYLNTLSKRSSQKERVEIAGLIDSLIGEKHLLLLGQQVTSIDALNFALAADWLRAMLLYPRLSINTVRTYFFQVSAVLRTELAGENLNGLNQTDMEAILENCVTGNSAKVLKAAMKSFHRYISKVHKIEIGTISWSALNIRHIRKDTPILWPSDVLKILKIADDSQIRQAVRLGFCCGMRTSEIVYLHPRNIHLEGEPFLDLKITKSKAGKRRLPLCLLMTEKEIEEFRDFIRRNTADPTCWDTLFVNAGGLPFLNPQALSMAVERVIARAGYPWATFYTLRHSFASILLLRWFRAHVFSRFTDDFWQELDIYDLNNDRALLQNGLHGIGCLLGHADVRTTVANYIHTADLLQKAFLDLYEREHHLSLSYSQAIYLTGYSQAALYKRFSPTSRGLSGIQATELIKLQIKRLSRLIETH
jgi:site-specific recombinase XerD